MIKDYLKDDSGEDKKINVENANAQNLTRDLDYVQDIEEFKAPSTEEGLKKEYVQVSFNDLKVDYFESLKEKETLNFQAPAGSYVFKNEDYQKCVTFFFN